MADINGTLTAYRGTVGGLYLNLDATTSGGGAVTSVNGTAGQIAVAPTTGNTVVALVDTAVAPGLYGSSTQVGQFQVDAKGRLTFAQNVAIAAGAGSVTSVGAGTGLQSSTTNPITSTGVLSIANTGVAAGTFNDLQPYTITINPQGQLTNAQVIPALTAISFTLPATSSSITNLFAKNVFVFSTAASCTVLLPAAAGCFTGQEYKISNESNFAIAIQTSVSTPVTTLAAGVPGVAKPGWGFFTCIDTAGVLGINGWTYHQGATIL